MTNLAFSRYTYCIKINANYIALYNSLLIKTVFVSNNDFTQIENYLLNKDSLISDELIEMIQYLYENFFLVESASQDNELLEKARKNVHSPVISNTYVIITENCNFSCEYCFIKDAVETKKINMDTQIAEDLVSFLQKQYEQNRNLFDNKQIITFYGGEPLLNIEAIKRVIEKVEEIKYIKYWPKTQYSIITNGSLLTRDNINFLKNNNIEIGISLDGDKSANRKRIYKNKKETFDDVIKNIILCSDMNVPFSLSITITKDILKRQIEIINYIISLSPQSVTFNLLIPNPNQIPDERYYKEATLFMIKAFEQFKTNDIYEDRIMRKMTSFINNKLYLYDCCASGGNQLVITPEGKVGICHGFLNNMKYFPSSIYDTGFIPHKNEVYQIWNKRTPLFMDECQPCECLGICGGGCPYVADLLQGSIYTLDKGFCIHTKILLKWLLRSLFEQCYKNN